jgi:hypothetical protein
MLDGAADDVRRSLRVFAHNPAFVLAAVAALALGIGVDTAMTTFQGFGLEPIGEVLIRNVRGALLVLVGAVAFVLLIACANVANLLLVRGATRRRRAAPPEPRRRPVDPAPGGRRRTVFLRFLQPPRHSEGAFCPNRDPFRGQLALSSVGR